MKFEWLLTPEKYLNSISNHKTISLFLIFFKDDKIVIRRYYTSMRRNAEVINVRDAVLLKSGPRKKDLPFVARVASIWEEEDGESGF